MKKLLALALTLMMILSMGAVASAEGEIVNMMLGGGTPETMDPALNSASTGSNTIRLAYFYRREEIAIMKMCGATNGFIQWPFVVEGMLLGLTGALVAFFAQWGIYHLVGKLIIQGNGLSLVTMLSYGSMAKTILAIFCGTGAVIGVGGSLIAIRKFLQV